jgi:hypothetical protein
LKAVKDAAEVKAVLKKSSGGHDPDSLFKDLMAEVKEAIPRVSRVVLLHIIMDH